MSGDSGRAQRRKIYTGYKWKVASRAFLKANPQCVDCGNPARCTDHMRGHTGDWLAKFWDSKYWAARCWSCHSRKTALTETGRGVGGRGFGPRGGEGATSGGACLPLGVAFCSSSDSNKGAPGPAKTMAEKLLQKRRQEQDK